MMSTSVCPEMLVQACGIESISLLQHRGMESVKRKVSRQRDGATQQRLLQPESVRGLGEICTRFALKLQPTHKGQRASTTLIQCSTR